MCVETATFLYLLLILYILLSVRQVKKGRSQDDNLSEAKNSAATRISEGLRNGAQSAEEWELMRGWSPRQWGPGL